MTKKNAKKDAARARQEEQGGHYQHHLRQEGGAAGRSDRAIEVLVFDPSGRHYHGIVWFVPPGLPNGAIDPTEGLIMGGIPTLRAGPYMLVEATGRVRHIIAERGAGGGAYMAVFTERDTFAAVDITYATENQDAHGMPTTFAWYRVVPDRSPPPSGGGYVMGILPLTDAATVKGPRTFGAQAWRQVFALLDAAHAGLSKRLALQGSQDTKKDAFDIDAHTKANNAVRESAKSLGEVQSRVLRTTSTRPTASRTTPADLDELAAADQAYREAVEAQMVALGKNPPPPGAADHAFEVVIASGRATVTVMRGATLATAHARAKHEATARRQAVYIRNAITGVTQSVGAKGHSA